MESCLNAWCLVQVDVILFKGMTSCLSALCLVQVHGVLFKCMVSCSSAWQRFAGYEVLSLVAPEAELEEIFLEFYGSGDPS